MVGREKVPLALVFMPKGKGFQAWKFGEALIGSHVAGFKGAIIPHLKRTYINLVLICLNASSLSIYFH